MKVFAVLLLLGIVVSAFADPVQLDDDSAESVDLLADEGDAPDENGAVDEDPASEDNTEANDDTEGDVEEDTEEDPKEVESDNVEDTELTDEQDVILEGALESSASALAMAVDDAVTTWHVASANVL
eukprot:gene16296-7682_t